MPASPTTYTFLIQPSSRFFFSCLTVLVFLLGGPASKADSIPTPRFILSTSLLEYFPDPNGIGNFNLGLEYYVKNGYSVWMNVGYLHSYGRERGIAFYARSTSPSQGVRIQVEGRKFLNWQRIFDPACLVFWPHMFQYRSGEFKNTGYYVALNSYYKQVHINVPTFLSARLPDAGNDTWSGSHLGLNAKFGYQCIKKTGFTIDQAVGVGLQHISYSGGVPEDRSWNKPVIGTNIYPSVMYQIKVGLRL